MGFLIPGGRFRRYGDSLLDEVSATNAIQDIIKVPKVTPIRGSGVNIDKVMGAKLAAASISRTAPTFNDPRYTFTTLSIPTDQRTLNGLYRFFDDMDPIVGNAIRLHVEFPLSRIALSDCGDPVIQRHYEDMCDRINLNKLLFDIGIEFWRIGNVFPFLAWNTDDYMWEQGVILNPDYVTVEGTYLNKTPHIRLQPDEHLRRIVTTGQPKELYDQLPEQIIKYVRLGQEIPLSPNNVFHIAHNKAPYENLGRSIIKRILKTLIYEDRMLMANFAIATRQVIPITVVKLGDPQSGWTPDQDEIDDFKEMLAAREIDPNFSIVYHWGVDIQFYGASGKIMNLANEFTRTLKWKLIGLGISEAILTGGANFATAYAQLEVLRQRYLHFQLLLERFVHKGLFEPVARLCGFYQTQTLQAGYGGIQRKHGEPNTEASNNQVNPFDLSNEEYVEFRAKKLATDKSNLGGPIKYIYPNLDWDLMSLNNDMQFKNFLMNFDRLFPQERKISEDTYYKAANLDKDAERKKLKLEHKERLTDALEAAKINKQYLTEFQKEGLIPPPEIAPVPPPGAGEGGLGTFPPSPGAPTAPGGPTPGGGVGPGGQVTTPSAPIGAGGAPGGPGAPTAPGSPSVRDESVNIQRGLTQSSIEKTIEKEGAEVVKPGLDTETSELKKANERMLKEREKDRGGSSD